MPKNSTSTRYKSRPYTHFHIFKIKSEEVLFPLKSSDSKRGIEILALVNISPINFCHNLYVIDPKQVIQSEFLPTSVTNDLSGLATTSDNGGLSCRLRSSPFVASTRIPHNVQFPTSLGFNQSLAHSFNERSISAWNGRLPFFSTSAWWSDSST